MSKSTKLCWFCGQTYRRHGKSGESIGHMVYSSHLYMSATTGPSDPDNPMHDEGAKRHSDEDHPAMCHECLRRYYRELPEFDLEYIRSQRTNYERAHNEMIDYETELIEWEERRFRFGCWFEPYPDIGVREKFWSLSLAELYARGWRLGGVVRLENPELDFFLARFGDPSIAASPEFVQHMAQGIRTSDPSDLARFAGVRACIFDMSVLEAAFEGALPSRRAADEAHLARDWGNALRHSETTREIMDRFWNC